MKGPHFFEKRKKEMARQEKAKQKAERKAQRKAGKGNDGEPGEDDDDLLLAEDGETHLEGQLSGSEKASEEVTEEASEGAGVSPGKDTPTDHASAPSRQGDPP